MSNQLIVSVSDTPKLTQLQYKKKPIIIWCPPCKGTHLILQKQLKQSGGKFVIAYVNCDEAEELNIQYQIQGVPTVIAINGKNQVIDKVVGYDQKKIKQLVDKIVKKQKK